MLNKTIVVGCLVAGLLAAFAGLWRYAGSSGPLSIITPPQALKGAGYTLLPFTKPPRAGPGAGFRALALSQVGSAYREKLNYNNLLDFSYIWTTSAGVAWSDFNNDGWMDLFAVSEALPRLYQNDGSGKLLDVTDKLLPSIEKVVGGVWGDYDNDGDVDLFITRYGDFEKGSRFKPLPLSNILLQNTGKGFVDVSQQAGMTQKGFSQGAAWGDMDGDGDLDLYVANYGAAKMGGIASLNGNLPAMHPATDADKRNSLMTASQLMQRYQVWDAYLQKDFLYRNNGDGTFTDVIDAAGIGGMDGWTKVQPDRRGPNDGVQLLNPQHDDNYMGFSFQPIWFDIDDDGDLDLYVATDFHRSQMFINHGDGTFDNDTNTMIEDIPTNAMGAVAFDADNDGDFDLFESCWHNNYLWINDGGHSFTDAARQQRLTEGYKIGWGVTVQDIHNDGHDEIIIANGDFTTLRFPGQGRTAEMKLDIRSQNSLYQKNKTGYRNIAQQLKFATTGLSRGLASADVNNDGFVDLAINDVDQGVTLFINPGQSGNGLVVQLAGHQKNYFGIGAKISILSNNKWQHKLVSAGNSFVSQDSPHIHFGLGKASVVEKIVVRWPNGDIQTVQQIPANHRIIIQQPGTVQQAVRHDGEY